MSRRRKILSIVWKALAILVVLLFYAAWPGRQTFTVSPETTYVTGLLDKDGYVDYVTALNERLSKGITPENNANVLIWQALGPHPEGIEMPSEYFKWLGIDPPPEDGEYLVSRSDYLKMHLIEAGGKEYRELMDRMRNARNSPWLAKDDPELAGWLKRKEKCLALAVEAVRRPEYFNPLVPGHLEDWPEGLGSALVPTAQCCRDLAAALVCRAMLRLGEGHSDEAWQDLLACHRLGRQVARGGTLIEWLVGVAIDRKAAAADLVFLDRSSLTSNRLEQCWNDLERIPPLPPLADKFDLPERLIALDLALTNVRERVPLFGWREGWECRPQKERGWSARLFTQAIDYDPTLRIVNRLYDRLVAALRITPRRARELELNEIEEDAAAAWSQYKKTSRLDKVFMGPSRRGEFIGVGLTGNQVRSVRKAQIAADRDEQVHRNLRITFALAGFHADAGRYPAKLDELAPKYLDKVPNDLFSDKPLIYKPNGDGYLLYSVGPNGKDDEGRTTDDDPRGDDIAVRMPVPRRKQ